MFRGRAPRGKERNGDGPPSIHGCRLHMSLLPDRFQMAMAVVDIQPVRAVDDAEALRISNKIDEELKVCFIPTESHDEARGVLLLLEILYGVLIICFRSNANSYDGGKLSRRMSKVCY